MISEKPKIVEIVIVEKGTGYLRKNEIIIPAELIESKTRNEVRKHLRKEIDNAIDMILKDEFVNQILGYNIR